MKTNKIDWYRLFTVLCISIGVAAFGAAVVLGLKAFISVIKTVTEP